MEEHMLQLRVIPPRRTTDKYGSGRFGAPRGDYIHRGVDLAAAVGSKVLALSDGTVSKIGYCYRDDLSFRYVELATGWVRGTTKERYFYLDPEVEVGQEIEHGDVLGTVQSLEERYPGITPHFHFEVHVMGAVIDPDSYR
jgi:peptidoglycan LD-endopeptidase LytH